jgi:hypothetical protein
MLLSKKNAGVTSDHCLLLKQVRVMILSSATVTEKVSLALQNSLVVSGRNIWRLQYTCSFWTRTTAHWGKGGSLKVLSLT